jgi:flagellar motility protein MotE (MotC chaperone)
MNKFLQSPLFAALLGLILYVMVTAMLWPSMTPVLPEEEDGATNSVASHKPKSRTAKVKGPSWDFSNPEVDALVNELRKEKQALADRARQLDELASRIQAEKAELSAVTQNVHQLQRELDQTVLKVDEEEAANLKKLAKIYSSMSPDGAASILKQLDEATVVKMMTFMKESETAPILETLAKSGDEESKQAASISERLRLTIPRKTATKTKS